jgi:hypothetical protein
LILKSFGLGLKEKAYRITFSMINAKERLIGRIVAEDAEKKVRENKFKNIPIVINNFNRYSALVKLIDWLLETGHYNIIVLDNSSTYPPLLDYYQKINFCKVIHLGANLGHTALWKSGFYKKIRNGYFCYTDPDLIPVAECPRDLVSRLLELLWKYPEVRKVGPGLRISDIPDHYEHKQQVITWESRYWQKPIEDKVYRADLDTTFALYRPRTMYNTRYPALRTGEPYVMHHTPWYENADSLSDEEKFYRTNSSSSSWWSSPTNEGPQKVNRFCPKETKD